MQTEHLPVYIDTETAARILGLSKSFLEKARFYRNPDAPPHVVFGRSAIRYNTTALLNWAAAREVSNARQVGSDNLGLSERQVKSGSRQ